MKFSNTVFLMLACASFALSVNASAPGGAPSSELIKVAALVAGENEILALTRTVVGNRLIEKACGKVMFHVNNANQVEVQDARKLLIKGRLKEMQESLRPVARQIILMDSAIEKDEMKEYVIDAAIAILASKTESKRISEYATAEIKSTLNTILDDQKKGWANSSLNKMVDDCKIQ